ncbi:MAG TPA: DUF885 domain-containing protein [Dongiaceae bacterium]|nr:DUF885 domain-containing protein [Dongiaceae bacterium]
MTTAAPLILRRSLLTAVALAALLGCARSPAPGGGKSAGTDKGSAGGRFADLVERNWQWRLRESPTYATSVGVNDFNDRLDDLSLAAIERRDGETKAFLAELDAIPVGNLSEGDRTDAAILRTQLVEAIDAFRLGDHLLTLNADSGFHTEFMLMHRAMPFATVKDYENYLARLEAFPGWMDQNIELMRAGLTRGITVPKATLAGIETSIEPLAGGAPEKHPVYEPFTHVPPTIPDGQAGILTGRAKSVIAAKIIPGYAKFLDFMRREYVPGSRETLAATALPDGDAFYRFQIRRFTSLDLDPKEVHELGLKEVARIRSEMQAVIAKTGFKGSLAQFQKFLRTDPRFYAKTPEALLKEASFIAKRMDAKLPSLFGRLPRKPYGVQPVPAALAPKYTSGRYSGSPQGSTEPGWFWVNTYALDTRPLYNLEALTFHEAVPGHHLQGALAQENDDVRPFRRYSYISAYGEGWGLYSEWLGIEAGFYTDPYSDFGRLGYQAWRASRLVVDTGVHAFGWTRQQAIDYLVENTSLPIHEATTETDRYISWPGQALSYYIGYLKIRELRTEAERALGERFDKRAFHDEILRHGSVPLPVLERLIRDWIAKSRSAV